MTEAAELIARLRAAYAAWKALTEWRQDDEPQRCSGCSELVPKALAVRTHSCPSCGLVIDRDWNAALNILQAVVGLGTDNVARWGERQSGNLMSGGILDVSHFTEDRMTRA